MSPRFLAKSTLVSQLFKLLRQRLWFASYVFLAIRRFIRNTVAFIGRLSGHISPLRSTTNAPEEVLMIGGYGYANTGDEAQLGANIARWRALTPKPALLVLSPNPGYTAAHHACRSALASRVVMFHSDRSPAFNTSSAWFRFVFWATLGRMEINAALMRAGIAPLLATSAEARLLATLQSAAALHVSGGGFMTGPTRSRLWDTCLILRLCQRFGTPYFLTGQTLGIFERWSDRWLARSSLRGALGISLRDPVDSERELRSLGIDPKQLVSSVDDALFCERAGEETLAPVFSNSGLDPSLRFLAVNYHWWGMTADERERSSQRMAEVLDGMSSKLGLNILMVPMVPSDKEAQRAVLARMQHTGSILEYDFDYRVVRGVIARAMALISFKHHPLIFALGEGTPCLSISFDPYYVRKNTGAMANLGQEGFCIDHAGFYDDSFITKATELISNRDAIARSLQPQLAELRAQQDAFFAKMVQKAGLTTN